MDKKDNKIIQSLTNISGHFGKYYESVGSQIFRFVLFHSFASESFELKKSKCKMNKGSKFLKKNCGAMLVGEYHKIILVLSTESIM